MGEILAKFWFFPSVNGTDTTLTKESVEEHRSLGGSIISRLYNGLFVGLIYELLVFS